MKPAKSLAVAYAVKRKSMPNKMATGGPVSAKAEARPMPDQKANDSKDVAQNDMKKALPQSSWTARPDKASRKGMHTTPIKHPRMVASDALSTRLRSHEDDLMESAKVNNGPQEEPPKDADEMHPDRKGPSTPALKMKKMAEGGMINKAVSMNSSEEDEDQHPAGLESDDDERSPSEDEIMSSRFAEGGEVLEDDDQEQPMDEEEMEHHSSIAAAIMDRKAKMMAEGGEVDLDENSMEQPNSFYHQNEDAALKENYDSSMEDVSEPEDSNMHGDTLTDEDAHDMVSRIMKRAMRKSPMVK